MQRSFITYLCGFGFAFMLRLNAQDIERLDLRLDALVPPYATVETLATGFNWTEGPVWDNRNQRLLFSNVPMNRIHTWAGAETAVYMEPSGYTGGKDPGHTNIGSNGLAMDDEGRLIICRHGDRNVVRQEADGVITVLADRWQRKRLNSPNDLTVHPSGDVYFTDPCFGLAGGKNSEDREIDVTGVYRIPVDGGELELVVDELSPNGIVFAPDGKTLYITSDGKLMRCTRNEDGSLGERTLFFTLPEKGAFDGLTVDALGNVYACNWKGGVFVIAPDGTHLGTIRTGHRTANCVFGGEDGKTLFITSGSRLCRIAMKVTGAHQ